MHILMPKDRKINYRLATIPIMLFIVVFFIWASTSEIDEVVRGHGKVIPNSQTQVLQHLEGGIISDIIVREGDMVKKGEVIYRLSQAFFDANLREKEIETYALQAKKERLNTMLDSNQTLIFSESILQNVPIIARNERRIFESKMSEYLSNIKQLEDIADQKRLRIEELESKLKNLEIELNLARESLSITEKLYRSKATSRQEYLRELSKKQNLVTETEDVKNKIPALKEEFSEALLKIGSEKSKQESELLSELNEVSIKLQQLEETNRAIRDRSLRSSIKSPVDGIVNKLYFHTIGGIIKPGDKVAEITPINDSLMIEAKIKPSDRADIWVGQKARVEITAYDFSRYGMLNGDLVNISADTFTDEQGQVFYNVFVKVDRSNFGKDKPIMPGMLANIHILTGKKTVLEYILIPIKKVANNALIEK
ncbi:MAG: HlyD family type I secretion periplasmic adaptor subunit [Campylobacterales bacterium]